MRLLGIDYGEKKIGIAVSDEERKFAFPLVVIENISAKSVLKELKIICDKNNIGKIIIGQSLDFKGQPNSIMRRIDSFKPLIENGLKIPVEFENETLTSRQAGRKMAKARPAAGKRHRKSFDEKIHASAAALILQSYLDKRPLG